MEQEKIELLDKLLEAMIKRFPSLLRSRRFTCNQALFFLLFSLQKKGGPLHTFLDLFVFRSLVTSIEPSDDAKCTRPGMPAQPDQRPQPCMIYSDLWKSLHIEDHRPWMERRGYELDAETARKIAHEVYDRYFEAVIKVLDRLDLAVKSELEVELPDGDVDPMVDDDENKASKPQLDDDENKAILAKPHASCMSGRERPRSSKDMELFLNLVDLCQLFMRDLPSEFFMRSYFTFCKCMIEKSNSHPLISGFFKLLTAAMPLIEMGGFLNCSHDRRICPNEGTAIQSEPYLCRTLLENFAEEVVMRCTQFFQDLLASSLEFILSMPDSVRKAQTQIPALRAALKMGISHSRIAEIAFNSLEKLIENHRDQLRSHLPQVLPLLDAYLVLHSHSEDFAGPVLSVEQRNRRLAAMLKKGNRWDGWSAPTEQSTGKRELALRAVRLLGNLGPDSAWLCDDVGSEDFTARFDVRRKTVKVKCGLDDAGVIFIDAALVRIAYLAQNTTDRQCKVSACELLHALSICAVGEHASISALQNQRADRSLELKKFDDLFRFLLPAIFRLAVDSEVIATRLFDPLSLQLVRWFASRTQFECEAQIVMEAILLCLESPEDGKLREESSKWLSVHVKWTLKGMTAEIQQENPVNVKNMLRRLYGLLNHPSVCKRLGGYCAFFNLSDSLSTHPRIVDQFLLEIFHHLILSLRFVSLDDPALDTEKNAVHALSGLEKILFRKKYVEMLNKPRQGKGVVNRRREYAALAQFCEFLFGQIGSNERPVRRYCRQLFFRLSSRIDGYSQPIEWIHKNAVKLPNGFDCASTDFSTSRFLLKTSHLKSMIAVADAWEWLIANKLASTSQISVKAPNLLKEIGLVASSLYEDSAISVDLSQSEKVMYSLEKSRWIYAVLKLIASCMDLGCEQDLVEKLLDNKLQRLFLRCLFVPRDLGLNIISDPVVSIEIPRQAARLLSSASKFTEVFANVKCAAADFVSENSRIQLGSFNLDTTPLDLYEILRLFSAYRLLATGAVLENIGNDARMLLKSLSERRASNLSPAKKEAAASVLKFSLKVLGSDGDPLSVWSEIFADIKGVDWRECVSWKFYDRFRDSFDEYLATKFVQSAKQREIIFRKALKSEFGAVILGNLLDFAVRDQVANYRGLNATESLAQTRQRSLDLVKVFLENFDFIDKMIASGDGGHILRKQQVFEIIGRLVFLAQEDVSCLSQRACNAFLSILRYFRIVPESGTLSAIDFQLFVTALKVLPGMHSVLGIVLLLSVDCCCHRFG